MGISRGVLMKDPSVVNASFSRIWEEVRVTDPLGDGMMVDNSFHQHGSELEAGSYGSDFTADTFGLVVLASNTSFEIDEGRLALLQGLLLDGQAWMIAEARWDWSVKGREITRTPPANGASSLLSYSAADLPSPRRSEMVNLYRRLQGASSEPLVGFRHFYCSDYSVRRADGWMASVHLHSKRTVSARCVNEEGKLSMHEGDGVVYLYLRGNASMGYNGTDYDNVFPVWNWQQLPGITALQDESLMAKLSCNYASTLAADSLAMNVTGGVAGAESGLSAMRLVSNGVTARKSFHFFSAGFAQLVTGVKCTSDICQGKPVYTTLFSQPSHGLVLTYSAGGVTHELAPSTDPGAAPAKITNITWLHDGRSGYVLLGSAQATFELTNAFRSGMWQNIGAATGNISLGLMSATVDHGPRFANVAYVVFPQVPASHMDQVGCRVQNAVLDLRPHLGDC